MTTAREEYLREYAEQQGLLLMIVPLKCDCYGYVSFDCSGKNPFALLYYYDEAKEDSVNEYVAIFYHEYGEDNSFSLSQEQQEARFVDVLDIPADVSLSIFRNAVECRMKVDRRCRFVIGMDFTEPYVQPSLYYIGNYPKDKANFVQVDVADLLEEIHLEKTNVDADQLCVYQNAEHTEWQQSTLTAQDAHIRKNITNNVVHQCQEAFYLEQNCVVYQSGALPFYFDASKGGAYVSGDSAVWKVKQGKVIPQYLMMQLYSTYAVNQYFSQFRIINAQVLSGTYIYLPEGVDDFSLYEQQRLFVKARTEVIQTFAMKYGVSMEADGQLPASHFLQGGKYQIIEHIDNGGFGKVYHATEKEHGVNQDVALKELFVREYCRRKDFSEIVTVAPANEKDYERQKSKFIDEYNILQKVGQRTSYVPKLMSTVFSENNTLYYALQYFDNGTLWHHCQEKDIDAQDKLRIVCQAGIALHHAHDLNYLHLDVTPVNIMVDSQGNGLLIDFGNSKHYSVEQNKFTSVANAAHTRCFAPPELMQQVVGQYSMEMDVYSLALTLFTALTGKVPKCQTANGNFGKNIDKHLKEASVAECIRQAIGKAVKYNAEDRYHTIRDFLLALLPAITDEQLRGEIEKLTCVTGFMASTHKNPADGQHSDFIPLSE